jgi:hypothetical protein
MWQPIGIDVIRIDIRDAEAAMSEVSLRLWRLIRIEPEKWQQHPYGDMGGGFWAVGLFGHNAIWYNDIEQGYNISQWTTWGLLNEYWCNQDDLLQTVNSIRAYIDLNSPLGKFGPPISLV